ncbi:hypothetical protein JTB14_010710 [Gonioctena quinquepunctata]|nr:hypothetical protein JTB14_010710 [Gonioctena quinquepunctata]
MGDIYVDDLQTSPDSAERLTITIEQVHVIPALGFKRTIRLKYVEHTFSDSAGLQEIRYQNVRIALTLLFQIPEVKTTRNVTKRVILSSIAQFYDPLVFSVQLW